MRTRLFSVAALAVVMVTGCGQILPLLAPLAFFVPGSTPCRGKPCERDRWLAVYKNGAHGLLVDLPGDGCDAGYDLSFGGPRNGFSSVSLNESRDLLVAVVTGDGVLHLAAFGDSEPLVEADLDARYAAWSNSGDRLAVLVGRAPNSERSVLLLSPELDEIARFDLGNTANGPLNWSADDSRIAVTGYSKSSDSTCIIVNVDTGVIERLPGVSCVFIGDERIVGWNDAVGQYAGMTLQDGTVRDVAVLQPQPMTVRPGYAKRGVFLARHRQAIVFSTVDSILTIRTENAGPILLTDSFFVSDAVLIPIDTARPVLEAAGFSVDGPCADQSGSGGG